MSRTAMRVALATGIIASGTFLGSGPAVAADDGCRLIQGTLESVTRASATSFTTSTGTYRYDSNDNFSFGAEGDRATYAQFQRELSVGDDVQIGTYCSDRAGKSGFALFEYAEPTPKCQQINGTLDWVTRACRRSFTTSTGTYRYDRNDRFAFGAEGDRASYTQFRRELSVGDDVQIFTYCSDRAGKSGFALFEYAEPTPSPEPTATPKPMTKPPATAKPKATVTAKPTATATAKAKPTTARATASKAATSGSVQQGTTQDGTPAYGLKETPQGGVAAGGGWASTQGQQGQQGEGGGTMLRVAGALGAGLAATGGVLLYRRRSLEG